MKKRAKKKREIRTTTVTWCHKCGDIKTHKKVHKIDGTRELTCEACNELTRVY